MKKNIRSILLGELLLFLILFLFNILMSGEVSSIPWFVDAPSLILVMVVLIPGMFAMGIWKDFCKSFSVGIRQYSLLELKNIILAVDAAQKLTVFGALFAIIISAVVILSRIDDPSHLGSNLAVCFLSGLYAVIVEFFLLPLRINAEHKMNEDFCLTEIDVKEMQESSVMKDI